MAQERVRGRRRYSEAERREYVRLSREGELTQSAFADRHGIKVCTLRRWIYQDRDRMAGSGDTGRFREISLSVPGLGMSGTVDILLGDGITVRLTGDRSPEFIGLVVSQLRRPC